MAATHAVEERLGRLERNIERLADPEKLLQVSKASMFCTVSAAAMQAQCIETQIVLVCRMSCVMPPLRQLHPASASNQTGAQNILKYKLTPKQIGTSRPKSILR